MPKSYYLAADGGGTKLQAVLYDEELRVVRTARIAGVNTLFKPVDVVRANVEVFFRIWTVSWSPPIIVP